MRTERSSQAEYRTPTSSVMRTVKGTVAWFISVYVSVDRCGSAVNPVTLSATSEAPSSERVARPAAAQRTPPPKKDRSRASAPSYSPKSNPAA